MFEEWFQNRVKDIIAEADPMIAKDLEKAAQIGKALVDYFMLELNGLGISITTQPVKKADPAGNLPERFRG